MKENSIKEDIERLKLCSTNQCHICGRYEKEECMLARNRCEQHLLSDYKRVLKENEIIKGNYDTLSKDIQQVTKELGLPEDTIIADEMVQMIKQKFIPKSKVKDKIEELKLIVEKYDRQRENDEDTVLCYEEVSIYWSKIKAYEELLEKEK